MKLDLSELYAHFDLGSIDLDFIDSGTRERELDQASNRRTSTLVDRMDAVLLHCDQLH